MNHFALFTDVSLNPQARLGIGGYLLLPVSFLENEPQHMRQMEICSRLQTRKFTETSSTLLEVQTILWALETLEEQSNSACGSLHVYTDSQCVAGLVGRRAALEQSDFIAKRSGQLLRHAPLYRQFYSAYDRLGFQVSKVSGHSRSSTHDTVHRIFSHVDKEVRKTLAAWLHSSEFSQLLPIVL